MVIKTPNLHAEASAWRAKHASRTIDLIAQSKLQKYDSRTYTLVLVQISYVVDFRVSLLRENGVPSEFK